ncbi:hypothetical protein, partial [Vibrio parahaemolyticus]|uniref:hypothetical protein n=1 Tax=Vibrio parahaemolyticus TaxID=670 RepID=UPI001D14D657
YIYIKQNKNKPGITDMSTTYPIAGQKFPKENKTTAPYPVKNLAKAIKRHSYFQWNLLTF